MTLWPVLLVALIGCPKTSSAPAAGASTEQGYAWSDGMSGERAAHKVTGLRIGDKVRERTIESIEQLAVASHTDGLKLIGSDGRIRVEGAGDLGMSLAAVEAIATVPVAQSITPQGRFGGLIDPEDWEAAAKDAVIQALGGEGSTVGFVAADMMVDPEGLEAIVDEEWGWIVERWLDPPTEGETRTALSRKECEEAGAPAGCVALSVSHPPPLEERVPNGTAKVETGLAALELTDDHELHFDSLEVSTTVISDPAGLVPYRFTRMDLLSGRVAFADRELPFEVVEHKQVVWRWAGR